MTKEKKMKAVYGAYCYQCGDLSIIPATEEIHVGLAKNHNEATGHTCKVYKETRTVFFDRREVLILPNEDKQLIKTFPCS